MFADAGLELFSLLRRDIDNLHAVSDSIPLRERGGEEGGMILLIRSAKKSSISFTSRLSLSQEQISTE